MKLKNYMEDAVAQHYQRLLDQGEIEGCTCERCKMDTIAFALNHLPSKYVVTNLGHTYTRVAEVAQQFETDMVVAITKAAKHVAKKPRH
jgi:competence protein ComFB